jgi:hypothetical protein
MSIKVASSVETQTGFCPYRSIEHYLKPASDILSILLLIHPQRNILPISTDTQNDAKACF